MKNLVEYINAGGSGCCVLEGPGGMRWASVSDRMHDEFVVSYCFC